MTITALRIEPADFHADHNDLHAIRDRVFVNEQRIPHEIEWDEYDACAVHLIARDPDHRPIGTGRLTPEGRIGRLAVLSEWRRRGVGSALLDAMLFEARKRGWLELRLNAQVSALRFYQRFGFEVEGEIFSEADIPHRAMRLSLAPLPETERRTFPAIRRSIAGVEFDRLDEAAAATQTLIAESRREIGLVTPHLEPGLYGRPEIIEAFRQFALRSRDGRARIVVLNPLEARGHTHPLLELVQNMPSSFQFRMPVEAEDQGVTSAYLCNDSGGYLFRLQGDRYAGVWSPFLPGRNRQLAEEFERLWQRSELCSEFRTLTI